VLLIATALVGPLTFLAVVALRQQRKARRLIAATIIGAAVVAAVLSGTLSDGGLGDVIGRVLVVLVVTVVARAMPERVLLGTVAVATAMAAAGPGGPVAALALGLAAAEYGRRRAALWKRQAIGAGIGAAAVGLPPFVPARPAVAVALLVTVMVTGWFGATRAQRRLAVRVAGVAAGVGVALAAAAAVRLRTLPQDLSSGQNAMQAGIDALRTADTEAGTAHLVGARASFDRAGQGLRSPLVAPLRLLPVLGQHVELGQNLAQAASELALRSQAVVEDGNVAVLAPQEGKIDLAAVRAIGPDIEAASRSVVSTRRLLEDAENVWLAPPVRDRLRRLDDSLARGGDQLDALALALKVLPALLGEGSTRRGFAGFTTPSEVRGLGGILGNFVELEATDGTVTLTRTGRDSELNTQGRPAAERTVRAPPGYLGTWGAYGPQTLWQNVTLSPDGPSVAQAVAGLYPQSGGKPVDIVAMIDANGLAALLELTGPLTVSSWPEPLTSANATAILGIHQYERYPDNEVRIDFLTDVTRTTFDRLLTLDPKRLRLASTCLGRAVKDRHIVLWSARPEEQLVFSNLGVTGALPQPTEDEEVAGVVLNNAAGNKIDWFTTHTTNVERGFDTATGDRLAVVTTTITNDAPRSGLPAYVANSVDAGAGAKPGDHRLLVSAYGTGVVDSARVGGRSLPVTTSSEAGFDVATAVVQIPAGTTREVSFMFRTPSDGRPARRLTLLPDQRPASETLCR
jgi:hypothetical protein